VERRFGRWLKRGSVVGERFGPPGTRQRFFPSFVANLISSTLHPIHFSCTRHHVYCEGSAGKLVYYQSSGKVISWDTLLEPWNCLPVVMQEKITILVCEALFSSSRSCMFDPPPYLIGLANKANRVAVLFSDRDADLDAGCRFKSC
jgi:hypothetical protein